MAEGFWLFFSHQTFDGMLSKGDNKEEGATRRLSGAASREKKVFFSIATQSVGQMEIDEEEKLNVFSDTNDIIAMVVQKH